MVLQLYLIINNPDIFDHYNVYYGPADDVHNPSTHAPADTRRRDNHGIGAYRKNGNTFRDFRSTASTAGHLFFKNRQMRTVRFFAAIGTEFKRLHATTLLVKLPRYKSLRTRRDISNRAIFIIYILRQYSVYP